MVEQQAITEPPVGSAQPVEPSVPVSIVQQPTSSNAGKVSVSEMLTAAMQIAQADPQGSTSAPVSETRKRKSPKKPQEDTISKRLKLMEARVPNNKVSCSDTDAKYGRIPSQLEQETNASGQSFPSVPAQH